MSKPAKPAATKKEGAPEGEAPKSKKKLIIIIAAVALIAAGYGNTFHLPAPQTLERLARRRSAVYRTDLDGTIFLRSTGHGFTVSTTKP